MVMRKSHTHTHTHSQHYTHTDDVVALLEAEGLGVRVLGRQVLDVGVEVALARGGDDGVDDGGPARLGLAEALVGADELALRKYECVCVCVCVCMCVCVCVCVRIYARARACI